MRASVILSTYQAPRALALVLEGYAAQNVRDFEIVVADDGSGPETGAVVERLRRETDLEIEHVWHEDEGFRKCRILNRAIVEARASYLIFSDGDCVPRDDFVAAHLSHAGPGRFLSGGRVMLSREMSEAVTVEDVRSADLFDPDRLAGRGAVPRVRDRFKLTRDGGRARLLDRITPTRATWNGHNASAAKSDLLAVNGFDERLGYGGEDRELGERLRNYGLRALGIRYRAVCVHLEHGRGYVDPEDARRIEAVRRKTRGVPKHFSRFEGLVRGPAWTEHGIRKGPPPS